MKTAVRCAWLLSLSLSATGHSQEQGLKSLLEKAYANNPSIQAQSKLLEREESLISVSSAPADPMIGFATLDRGNRTQYLLLSQKIDFPTKYFLRAGAQRNKAEAQKNRLDFERAAIRQRVISSYYALYSVQKTLQLVKANIQTVREFARIAESKYAAGKAPQADSMKAHFELTKLELDLLSLEEEEVTLRAELGALLGESKPEFLNLENENPATPNFLEETLEKQALQNSPILAVEESMLDAAKSESSLAWWELAPDIQFQYQERISGSPMDSRIYSIGFTVPLWFWKKSASISAARAQQISQDFKTQNTRKNLLSDIEGLKTKIKKQRKVLEIYQTSLIPQAQGSYNSSKAAYTASKTTFLSLLDAEKSMYLVRIGFFKALRQYVSNLTELETKTGLKLSNFIEGK